MPIQYFTVLEIFFFCFHTVLIVNSSPDTGAFMGFGPLPINFDDAYQTSLLPSDYDFYDDSIQYRLYSEEKSKYFLFRTSRHIEFHVYDKLVLLSNTTSNLIKMDELSDRTTVYFNVTVEQDDFPAIGMHFEFFYASKYWALQTVEVTGYPPNRTHSLHLRVEIRVPDRAIYTCRRPLVFMDNTGLVYLKFSDVQIQFASDSEKPDETYYCT